MDLHLASGIIGSFADVDHGDEEVRCRILAVYVAEKWFRIWVQFTEGDDAGRTVVVGPDAIKF
jgi:hypothetical protein